MEGENVKEKFTVVVSVLKEDSDSTSGAVPAERQGADEAPLEKDPPKEVDRKEEGGDKKTKGSESRTVGKKSNTIDEQGDAEEKKHGEGRNIKEEKVAAVPDETIDHVDESSKDDEKIEVVSSSVLLGVSDEEEMNPANDNLSGCKSKEVHEGEVSYQTPLLKNTGSEECKIEMVSQYNVEEKSSETKTTLPWLRKLISSFTSSKKTETNDLDGNSKSLEVIEMESTKKASSKKTEPTSNSDLDNTSKLSESVEMESTNPLNNAELDDVLSWSFVEEAEKEVNEKRILFEKENSTLKTSKPLATKEGFSFFEIEIVAEPAKKKHFRIGLTTKETRVPGVDIGTIAYVSKGTQGRISVNGKRVSQASPLEQGDVVGFYIKYVNVENNSLSLCQIRKNGQIVGKQLYLEYGELYPTIKSYALGLEIQTNLGNHPSKFQIEHIVNEDAILSWDCSDLEEGVQCDGSQIIMTGEGVQILITTQAIPECLESFYYDIELSKESSSNEIMVGMESDTDEIRYNWEFGSIDMNGKEITMNEELTQGDVMGIGLQRIRVDGITYQWVSFYKNGKRLGSPWMIDGSQLRPKISLIPTAGEEGRMVVESSLGDGKARKTLGQTKEERLYGLASLKPLEEIEFQKLDGSEFVFSDNGLDGSTPDVRHGVPAYFEVSIPSDSVNTLAIVLKSDSDMLLYHGASGSIANIKNKSVTSSQRFGPGDTIGCRVWGSERIRNQKPISIISIEKNGEKISSAFCLEGRNVKPSVYAEETENSGVIINCGENEFVYNSGPKNMAEASNSSMKQKVALFLWWFLSFHISPYFCWYTKIKSWLRPVDPKLMIISFVLAYASPLVDVGTDANAGISHIQANNVIFGYVTIGLMFMPAATKFLMEGISLVRFIFNYLVIITEDVALFFGMLVDVLWLSLKKVICQFPLVQPLTVIPRLMELSQYKDGQQETERITLEISDESMLEPYTESSCQLLLQLYVALTNGAVTTPMTLAIVSSILTISLAAVSNFMNQRINYPVGCLPLLTKLFLTPIFTLTYAPRMVNFALLLYTLNSLVSQGKDRIIWGTVSSLSMMLFIIGATYISLKTTLWDRKLPPKYQLKRQQKTKKDDENIASEEEYETINYIGFEQYFNELKWKGLLLAAIVPSIVLHSRSRFFHLTSLVSTGGHMLLNVMGFCCYLTVPRPRDDVMLMNTTSGLHSPANSTSNAVETDEKNTLMICLFVVTFIMLGLSIIVSNFLAKATDQLYLRKFVKKWSCGLITYTHASMIGQAIEEEARKEFELEQEAKSIDPEDWQDKLNSLHQSKIDNGSIISDSTAAYFKELCTEDIDLRQEVITEKKSNNDITSRSPLDMVKNLRWPVLALKHVLRNIENNEKKEKNNEDVPSIQTKSKQNVLFELLQKGDMRGLHKRIQQTKELDLPNSSGNTPLQMAIEAGNKTACRILITEGASYVYQNREGLNAFQLAVKQKKGEITNLVFSRIKRDAEIKNFLGQLCTSGETDSIHCFMDQLNASERKEVIEMKIISDNRFAFLQCMYVGNEEAALLLLTHHKDINYEFLLPEGNGENLLQIASKLGYVKIVNELVTIYDAAKIVTAIDNDKCNALMWAADNGHEAVVRSLINYFLKDDKIHQKDIFGDTALDLARRSGHDNIVQFLEPFYT